MHIQKSTSYTGPDVAVDFRLFLGACTSQRTQKKTAAQLPAGRVSPFSAPREYVFLRLAAACAVTLGSCIYARCGLDSGGSDGIKLRRRRQRSSDQTTLPHATLAALTRIASFAAGERKRSVEGCMAFCVTTGATIIKAQKPAPFKHRILILRGLLVLFYFFALYVIFM